MPTKKPRLTITLEPRVYSTLTRLSELSGQSLSSIIGDYLGAVHEPLMRTIALMEAAKEAPEGVLRGLRETAEQLERDMCISVEGAIGQLDVLFPGHVSGGVADAARELLGSVTGSIECTEEAMEHTLRADLTPVTVTRGSGASRVRKNNRLGRTRGGH